MEQEILDFIAADCRLDHLVKTMPQEYMDYIVDLFDPPFELDGEKDKEMLPRKKEAFLCLFFVETGDREPSPVS